MHREKLGSRLGFILLSAGCAIGIGNVWKFPYVTGENGGGFFVLIYLFFLIILGIPIMTIEFSLGRASQKSPAKLYIGLEPEGTKWHIHSFFAVIGNYILMMFYMVVAGWMFRYFVSTAAGKFKGLDAEGVSADFSSMLQNPKSMIFYTLIVIALAVIICSMGLQNGVEKITKFMMLSLLVIMVALAVRGLFLEGGSEGLKFYLMPSVENLKKAGVGNVIVAAMNQAFFTLSLGMGSMAIFGSYLKKERTLMGESILVAALDTFVAIASGLIIFPACASYGVAVDSGPNLLFVTLPNVFNHLPLGRLFGSLFFVFMSFAALTTVIAVFENIISCCNDIFGWSKKKASLINGVLFIFLTLPCIFGFNLLSGITPFGEGSTIMDLEDFAVSNIILPLGSLIFVLFTVSKKGWGFENFLKEANTGRGIKVRSGMKWYIKYVLPVIILCLFVIGIYTFFK